MFARLFILMQAAAALHAADPAAHTVMVPFDETKPIAKQQAQRYYLDRADFDRLWALAKENRKPEKIVSADNDQPSAVLHSALYRATIEDERFVLEAQFDVSTRGRWAKLPLVVKDSPANASLPLRELIIDGKAGAVTGNEVTFEQPGHHVVLATYEVAHKRGWSQVLLSPPVARAAMASIKLTESDAMPVFSDPKLVAVEEMRGTDRVVTVGLGSSDKLHFTRVQRRPVSEAIPPSADVVVTTSLTGEMRLHSVVRVRWVFPGSSRKEVSLLLDPAWTLDAAPQVTTGSTVVRDLRVAVQEEAGKPRLVAHFAHEVSDEVTLELHLTPKALSLDHTPLVTPLAARWETTARLIAQDGVQLNGKPTATQSRLSNETYSYDKQSIPVIRYRLGNGETLAFETKPADAKTSARIDYVYQLSEQKQELAAAIALKRERGAWRQLRVTLPVGMEVQGVHGPQLSAWELSGSDLFLRFTDSTTTEAKVVVYVANAVLKPTQTWTLSPLQLPEVENVTGSAIIATHAAKEARLDGFQRDHELREIDPATQNAIFIITPPLEKKRAIEFERAAWTLNVGLQDQPGRFSADGVMLAQATDLGVLLSQQVALKVEQGALKRVLVRFPKALPEATVTGDQLREMQSRIVGEMREYECTFQSQGGLLGSTALTFDLQLPLTDEALSVPFVEIADVERLRRFFVLDNSSSRESKILRSDGVDACAKDALPYLPNVATQPQFYQARPSGGLQVAFSQLQATSGNAAVITLADITTVLRADGERWDTVVYSLSNRSLQFLPVILPDKAELIAVNVSGEAVRADEEMRDGRRVRLIPLIQTRPVERSMEVRLVYRIRSSGLAKQIKLDDPELAGLSAERTVWTASLPPGWTLADADRDTFGNMEPIAEEGRDIEKLQSWMSDLSRINRIVSSSKDYDNNQAALAEAEKLNKQIADVTKKVESKRRYGRSAAEGKDNKTLAKLSEKTEGDLSKVNDELSRQVLVLSENRLQQGVFKNKGDLRPGLIGNGWTSNSYSGTTTVSGGQAGVLLGCSLNDNVAVGSSFFGNQLVLTGNNTYTGATTINAGGTVIGSGALVKSGAGTLVLSNTTEMPLQASSNTATVANVSGTNVFGFSSNARASGFNRSNSGVVDLAVVGGASGAVTISGGSLAINSSSRIGNASSSGTTFNGGVSVSPLAGWDGDRSLTQRPTVHFDTEPLRPESVDGLLGAKPKEEIKAANMAAQFVQEDAEKPRQQLGSAPVPAAAPAPNGDPFGDKNQPANGRTNSLGDDKGYILTTAVNQLRPSGRRSLQVEVPMTGEVFHFRKLKDHAMLDLQIKREPQPGKTQQATVFGAGLGLWALIAFFASKRRK
jgi:autotransporter-associated beta strand protein